MPSGSCYPWHIYYCREVWRDCGATGGWLMVAGWNRPTFFERWSTERCSESKAGECASSRAAKWPFSNDARSLLSTPGRDELSWSARGPGPAIFAAVANRIVDWNRNVLDGYAATTHQTIYTRRTTNLVQYYFKTKPTHWKDFIY